jgi:hypothetical protein
MPFRYLLGNQQFMHYLKRKMNDFDTVDRSLAGQINQGKVRTGVR